jgi:hypothetical protein
MQSVIALSLFDPSSWPDTFPLKVVAVVVGGVLLWIVGRVIGWLSIPFKWGSKNKELHDLIQNRREFLLVYPTPHDPASK